MLDIDHFYSALLVTVGCILAAGIVGLIGLGLWAFFEGLVFLVNAAFGG